MEELKNHSEGKAVQSYGGEVAVIKLIDKISTSKIVEKIKSEENDLAIRTKVC